MSDNSHNREALLRLAKLVQPALSTQDYIPALKHIKFEGGYATAYNDVSAITVQSDLNINRCVPGDLLIRALASFAGDSVMMQPTKEKNEILVSSGRAKLKMPCMTLEDFPFEEPKDDGHAIPITDAMLKGIERCLISVGTDNTHPAQMGVTLDAEEGKAVLYSTDNFTISRFETGDKLKLPGDAPVILPTFFCNQLLALARAFPKEDIDLVLIPGVLLAEFGKAATLMTKTLVDLEPLDFGRIIEKHCKLQAVAKNEGEIPAAFDAAISRASLVLSAEVDKAMRIKSLDSKSIHLHAESQQGVSDDEMQFAGSEADSFLVDPLLVARGLKGCTHMCISFPTVMVLRDESFTHVIAHCKG